MGGAAPWLDEVKALATAISASCTVHSNVTNMAALMAKADLAIGAAGGTSWERCCMGLPTIMLCLADNQREIARTLQSAGAGLAANSAEEVAKLLTGLLQERLEKGTMTGFLRDASVKAAGVTGGKGCAILMQAMDLKEQGQ
jgi:spore coat polysaccharide biosynthesis predicted glycosyltransferase SpsG